jgi:hypothetical protein
MSLDYYSFSFMVDAAIVPAMSISSKEFNNFWLEKIAALSNRLEAKETTDLEFVIGVTRNGTAIGMVEDLLKQNDSPSLVFLTFQTSQRYLRFDGGFYGKSETVCSIFAGERLSQVIGELENLLTFLAKHSDSLLRTRYYDYFDDAEIKDAIRRDYVCATPGNDKNVGEDESADYLFVWLRSILELAKNAWASDMVLVHVIPNC